jgi:hypothetical protein
LERSIICPPQVSLLSLGKRGRAFGNLFPWLRTWKIGKGSSLPNHTSLQVVLHLTMPALAKLGSTWSWVFFRESFHCRRPNVNIPQPLITLYNDLLPILDSVEKRVANSLSIYSRERLIPFISRTKTIESVAEKIETGRYASFADLDDLVAVTLVVPSLRRIKRH